MMRFILLTVLLSTQLWAVPAEQANLQAMLDLDRFHAYTQSWSFTMMGRGKAELSKVVLSLTPAQIAAMKLDPAKLADAQKYDDLLLKILQTQRPDLKVKAADVAWGYNFFKNKMNEAYLIQDPSRNFKPAHINASTSNIDYMGSSYAVKPLAASEVLLNVDGYVSNRTTRAVFWEASQSQRPIEMHVGSADDFRDNLTLRGSKIVGEVRTAARNYNPIYLIQDPGEKTFHYAITQISGQDRVRHLAMQASLVRWEVGKGKLAPPPPVKVVGDAIELLLKEEAELTQVLRVVPKADAVVIGQKGAFERTFGSLAKARAVMDLQAKFPTALADALTPAQAKLVAKAMAEEADLVTHVMKYASDWDKVYEAATPVLEKKKMPLAAKSEVFTLDRGSYEMTDFNMTDSKGKIQRWRVFSNSWGDEVLPVARALKSTGHNNVFYMGTAGGLEGSGLKVGDLVVPQYSNDIDGVKRPLQVTHIPEGAIRVPMVTHVSSPFEETGAWLKDRKKIAQVVEVETGYLAAVFDGPKDRVNTMLLVSDMVGVEGETLAEASSSARRKAQIQAISSVIDSKGVTRASVPAAATSYLSVLDEISLKRDPAHDFRVVREAQARRLDQAGNFRAEFKKLYAEIPTFTTTRLETVLEQNDVRLAGLRKAMDDAGLQPRMALDSNFLDGRWSPGQPIKLHLEVATEASVKDLNAIVKRMAEIDKNFPKQLSITVARTAAPKDAFVALTRLPSTQDVLMELYKDSALGFGGLASQETRSGGLKFVRVADPSDGKVMATLAYFPPDDSTKALLQELGSEAGARQVMVSKIAEMNAGVAEAQWKVVMKEVTSLPGGSLAQIVPEFAKNKNLQITVYMTKDGLKNPAVVMEELIHLHQITGTNYSLTTSRAFVHPYQWAEVVANARAGSLSAAEKLASVELEAAMSSKDSLAHFREQGLFSKASDSNIQSYFDKRLAHAETMYRDVAKKARADLKVRTAAWEKQKQIFAKLEGQKLKLNDLIAKGDRAGVRKLVQAYMPWDIMEPSEKKMWTDWLDAIETPQNGKKKLIFRGLDGDVILRTPQGKPFLMSTVLTKNQGSYTRRLRSLATMRQKFGVGIGGAPVSYTIKGRKDPTTLSTMMMNHADDPKGSPFISASNLDTASGFGSTHLSALMLDERRLVPNALAVGYLGEQERLIPLIVFPDEIVHYENYKDQPYDANRSASFKAAVEKKIGRPVTKAETSMAETSADFLKGSVNYAQDNFLTASNLAKPKSAGTCLSANGEGLFKTLDALLKD